MAYLSDILRRAKQDTPKTPSRMEEPEEEAAAGSEEKTLIDSYGEVRVFKRKGEPLLFYEVPSPRYRGEEKALIDSILEVAANNINLNEALFQTSAEKRVKLFHAITELLENSPELKLPANARKFYANAVVHEMEGFGLIDALVADDGLEEIMVIGVNRPVYVFHRKYGMMKTNVMFYEDKDIRDLIDRISRTIGRRIDIQAPLMDARLPDGTRVNATIPPISLDGSTLTLRKFREDPLSIMDLISNNTINASVAAFLWLAVDGLGAYPANTLVAGGTASGKCMVGSTPVVLADGTIARIQDVVEEKFAKSTIVTDNDGWEFSLGDGTRVLSMDQNTLQLKPAFIKTFWRHRAPANLVRVKTRTGREITVTPEHPFFTFEAGTMVKRRADELKVRDGIAVPKEQLVAARIAQNEISSRSGHAYVQLVDSQIFFDEIITIQVLENHGEKFVYDFTVEDSHTFIAGSNGGVVAHNTTSLNAFGSFIPNYERLVSIEDSVDGGEELIVFDNNRPRRVSIGTLVDEHIMQNGARFTPLGHEISSNTGNLEVFCFDAAGRLRRERVSACIRHLTRKRMFELVLRSGRRAKITADHCVFGLDSNWRISPLKTGELKTGDYIAVPRSLPYVSETFDSINILEHAENIRGFVSGQGMKEALRTIRPKQLRRMLGEKYADLKKGTIGYWHGKGIAPLKVFASLCNEGRVSVTDATLRITNGRNGIPFPPTIVFDETFMQFVGAWLADGCYDLNSVIVSVQERELQEVVKTIAQRFGVAVKLHSDNYSLMIHSSLLKEVMVKVLGLCGNAYTKRVPPWAWSLSDKQCAALLSGYFSGDGSVGRYEIVWASCSRGLMQDVQTLLLRLGILSRTTSSPKTRDKTYTGRISGFKHIQAFAGRVGFVVEEKNLRISRMPAREEATHDNSDIVPLPFDSLARLKGLRYSYAHGDSRIGRRHLGLLAQKASDNELKILADSDVFWDQVKEIKDLGEEERTVYDLSVPSHENFVCSNIFMHNTSEIRLPFEHWIRFESRPPGIEGSGEVDMNTLLKNALRMRPDRIIVGEIRGEEGYTLFNAMNTGHKGSLGTVHSNSARETLVRLASPPMNVPPIMLSALNFIVMQQRTYDRRKGLIRRVTEVAEVQATDANEPSLQLLFQWNAAKDALISTENPPAFFRTLSEFSGMSRNAIVQEWSARTEFLGELAAKGIREIGETTNALQTYSMQKQMKAG